MQRNLCGRVDVGGALVFDGHGETGEKFVNFGFFDFKKTVVGLFTFGLHRGLYEQVPGALLQLGGREIKNFRLTT